MQSILKMKLSSKTDYETKISLLIDTKASLPFMYTCFQIHILLLSSLHEYDKRCTYITITFNCLTSLPSSMSYIYRYIAHSSDCNKRSQAFPLAAIAGLLVFLLRSLKLRHEAKLGRQHCTDLTDFSLIGICSLFMLLSLLLYAEFPPGI